MLKLISCVCLTFCGIVSAVPTPFLASPRLLYQFGPTTFVENIASRRNGNLLLTTITAPVVHTLDPTADDPTPKIAYTFPGVTCTSGIAETNTPDVFVVATGNYSVQAFSGVYGTFSVWTLDFRKDPPVAKKIASIPDTDNLNGIASVQGLLDVVLIADGGKDAIRSLNIRTGKTQIVLQDPMFTNSTTFPLGINGLNTFGLNAYFTNSAQGIYGYLPIRPDGSAAGKAKSIAYLEKSDGSYDDFTMDRHGNALLAVKPSAIHQVSLLGRQSVLSGGMGTSDFAGPTSVTFGRGSRKEEATLYVTTAGLDPIMGGFVGGQVLAIENYHPHVGGMDSYWSFGGAARVMSLLWKQGTELRK